MATNANNVPKAETLTLICYDGSIDGPKTLESDSGIITLHHLLRKDANSLPTDFEIRNKSGIYVFVGESDEGAAMAYIGESNNIFNRICQPDHKKKEWWTSVYIFNPSGREMERGMRLYIENKMINDSRIERYSLENSKTNNYDSLSKGNQISADRLYLEMVKFCKTIGFPIFDPISSVKQATESGTSPVFTLRGKKHNAFLTIKGESFVLLPGTTLSNLSAKLDYKSVLSMRSSYSDGHVLKEEILFKSPSAAAAFAAGVNLSGRYEWFQEATGKSLGQWQDGD